MRTTKQLLENIQKSSPELYNQVMALREKHSNICIDMTRREAMALQQKTLELMKQHEQLLIRTSEPLVPGKTLYYIR